ncbi:unnamed protein product [Arctogadus glacialis]|jgi:hypothetical protein
MDGSGCRNAKLVAGSLDALISHSAKRQARVCSVCESFPAGLDHTRPGSWGTHATKHRDTVKESLHGSGSAYCADAKGQEPVKDAVLEPLWGGRARVVICPLLGTECA